MITRKEWDFANELIPGSPVTPKQKQQELVAREIDEYFAQGGVMTRREKSGALTFWTGPNAQELQRITLQQRNALVKAKEKA